MYDTVNFRLFQSEVAGVDFLTELPCYLENVGEHCYGGRQPLQMVSGRQLHGVGARQYAEGG